MKNTIYAVEFTYQYNNNTDKANNVYETSSLISSSENNALMQLVSYVNDFCKVNDVHIVEITYTLRRENDFSIIKTLSHINYTLARC